MGSVRPVSPQRKSAGVTALRCMKMAEFWSDSEMYEDAYSDSEDDDGSSLVYASGNKSLI